MAKRNPFTGWNRRTFKTFGIAWIEGSSYGGVFLFKCNRYGAWNAHAYIGETLGMDGVR